MGVAHPVIEPAEIFSMLRRQRRALATLLESLDEDEWIAPSLCSGWRVRDVVAHCVQSHVATPWRLAREMVAAGFRLDVRNNRWVQHRRTHSVSDVLVEYRTTSDRLGIPASEARYALVEAVVHSYDIARPLHRGMDVPPPDLTVVAETCRATALFLHGRQRATGITLRADDTDWSAGQGPEVAGPLASIILAITGRSAALVDLSGPGLSILRSRLVRL
jgi:uncharacterized protein (TIGR03083 family)